MSHPCGGIEHVLHIQKVMGCLLLVLAAIPDGERVMGEGH